MAKLEGEAVEIAESLSLEIAGQRRVIAAASKCIADWRSEPEPRFPLRLLFAGPTSVGKELLAVSIAKTMFSSRIVKHSCVGYDGPLRLNRDLRTAGPEPLVLFLKLFDYAEHNLEAVEFLLATGGILLGNGYSRAFPGSLVILSASHAFSETLAEAERAAPGGWSRALAAKFPNVAAALDAAIQFEALSLDDRAEIVRREADGLAKRIDVAIAVSDAAALVLAAQDNARNLDSELRLQVGRLFRDQKLVGALRTTGKTLLLDYAYGCFSWLAAEGGDTESKRVSMPISELGPPLLSATSRPRDFPALSWQTEWKFDAFISYKISKHLPTARALRDDLARLGYTVWLDEDQIGGPDDPWRKKTREQLIKHLMNGVGCSRCTIVFETVLEAVLLPPGCSPSEPRLAESVMRTGEGVLVAWNWQKLEIDSSSRTIVIHEGSRGLTVSDGTQDITASLFMGSNIAAIGLTAAICKAIDRFRNGSRAL
ncbi:hypothetical protein VQ03_27460 [Methylobacterium tarhaniae]|uniref:Uncharacterized protein n=1 Tax=Methylobacterium tarhaniae TaxID=1187852 RepID=A0A0J6SC09_9HYPH|nr:hypothetical protein [Methylobacterium tarhaniae]KMO31262.1 hypothetical protein VQ03_27460 [Methylobacterium tarhaniae]